MASFVNDEGPIIGIDLGTTYSCVAAYDYEAKKVVVLPNSGTTFIRIFNYCL